MNSNALSAIAPPALAMIDWYLAQGFGLVPVRAYGKDPVIKDWTNKYFRDSSWWTAHPLDNVGIVTGGPSGFFVLDEDPGSGGDVRLVELVRENGPLPATRTHRTGSGGRHFLFAMPTDFEPGNSRGRLPVGIDIRGTGGQIVAPPSTTRKGTYVVVDPSPIAPAPAWLLDLIRPKVHVPKVYDGPVLDAPTDALAKRVRGIVDGKLAAIAALPVGDRNNGAVGPACSLIEFANAPWSGLTIEQAEQAFMGATTLDEREAADLWAKQVRRVGEKQAEPLADRPHNGAVRESPEVWSPEALAPADGITRVAGPDLPAAPLTLPETFWRARPVFGHIRQAAHSRKRSADVALYSVLARLSAMWPHQLRVDTEVARPASLNLFVAVGGPSGTGKSSGLAVADGLLPVAPWLDGDQFRDKVPVGTGEGLAETYMGMRTISEPVVGDSGAEEVDTESGRPKTKSRSVRGQVRHNALFRLDEGEALTKMLDRAGQTIGATLRSAGTGDAIGQANADAQTRREIPEGAYSMALVVGFQPTRAAQLFADVDAGTPQRFVYVWAHDATVPQRRQDAPEHPGEITGVWKVSAVSELAVAGAAAGMPLIDPGAKIGPDLSPFVVEESIKDRLWAEDGMERAPLDTHSPGTRVKLAALLCALDGRRDVREDDWALAEQMWATSCAVRDHMISLSRAATLDEQRARTAAHVERERTTRAALASDDDRRVNAAVERVARRLAERVHAAAAPVDRAGLARSVAGRDRAYRADAIAYAVDQGWLVEQASPDNRSPDGVARTYVVGTSQPTKQVSTP